MPPLDVLAVTVQQDLFSRWNAKLLETFFSSASQGDEVWLQVDADELDLIGPELGGDEGFLKAVRTGPAWPTFDRGGKFARGNSADLVHRMQGLVRQRLYPANKPLGYIDPGILSQTHQGCKAPTYLPFLAALVRSSALSDKDGYYKHLREALQLPISWNSNQLAQLEIAWNDLAAWTKETNGRFGRFVPRRLGGYSHIGVPRAQCIMSRQDCEESSRVFAMAGLRPGQVWSSQLAKEVISCAASILSAGFRDALGYPELLDPIEDSLRSLFEDWDGSTLTSRSSASESDGHDDAVASGQVELALEWVDTTQRWQIHWRVPPIREGSEVVLESRGANWRAPIWGTDRCSTMPGATARDLSSASAALEDSATQDVYFEARLEEEGTQPASLGRYVFPRAELRVLAWGTDYASQRDELQERPLPRHGCAYLLATQRAAGRLQTWLQHEYIQHQLVDIAGLPNGWTLTCLTDCSKITEAQVNTLPGTIVSNGINRVIAIVGGRSISRASKRQYLSYDLPGIELDAPSGATLHTDPTLVAEEVHLSIAGREPGVRRFRLSLRDTVQKSFCITARIGNRELANIILRIAPDSGEQVTLGKDFSLDPQGRPQGVASGLRGALFNSVFGDRLAYPTPLSVPLDSLGSPVHALAIIKQTSDPAALFLDSLAQVGSLAYGTAKEQLGRLLARRGEAVRPDQVLLDLRCRGHVEIETSVKGHFVRIHAVPPAMYRLPIETGGRLIYAVLGTLKQQHWRSLFNQVGSGAIHCYPPPPGMLPAWKVLASDEASLIQVASSSGMAVLPFQPTEVAAWAAACDDVRAQIESGAVESIGALEHQPQRFHSGSGCFKEASSLSPQSACDLFRMDDRDIIGGRVYVLATKKEGRIRYGFVRDSRWGVWIALRSFGKFVKETFSIDDACPWPIPYSAKDRTVYLPARISLPVVLERALVLCRGQGPDVVEADARYIAEKLVIVRRQDGKGLFATSQVYRDMASGRWLAYRSVPVEVATILAEKLGATLANS
jgi:hypothetical protein